MFVPPRSMIESYAPDPGFSKRARRSGADRGAQVWGARWGAPRYVSGRAALSVVLRRDRCRHLSAVTGEDAYTTRTASMLLWFAAATVVDAL